MKIIFHYLFMDKFFHQIFNLEIHSIFFPLIWKINDASSYVTMRRNCANACFVSTPLPVACTGKRKNERRKERPSRDFRRLVCAFTRQTMRISIRTSRCIRKMCLRSARLADRVCVPSDGNIIIFMFCWWISTRNKLFINFTINKLFRFQDIIFVNKL